MFLIKNILILASIFFISADAHPSPENKIKKILILGDSLTEGYGVAKESAFPYQLELLLNKQKIRASVIAAGSSGSTSASAVSRLNWHLKSKPDILVLALGGNDGLRGVKAEATESNLRAAVQIAKKNNIIVYLAGMKLPINYGETYRKQFEDSFKKVVKSENLKEIPFLLEGAGGIKSLTLSDGIHPNEAGHKIIAQTLATYLEREL